MIPASRGYGIGTFNASLATLLSPMTDLTFSTRFKDFLSDPDRSIDTTPDADRDDCANNAQKPCMTSFHVPGGVKNFAAALLAGKNFTSAGSIQPVLALNQRGYSFEFEDDQSMVNYDPNSDCIVSGFVIGAFQLCLKNRASHELLACKLDMTSNPRRKTYFLCSFSLSDITSCPREIAANAACLRNTSWHFQNGWKTNLATHARFATIAYNGINGTILSHTYTNASQTAVDISATELLHVYDVLLSPVNLTSSFGRMLSLLGLGTNKPVLPLTVWEYFQGLQEGSMSDSRTNRQAAVGLQSFLALALYHCQNKDFNELRKLLVSDEAANPNLAQTVGQDIIDMFPSVAPDTDIVPAILRYNLQVDRSVLLAYVVLGGSTLALCLAAQVAGSFTRMRHRMREMSPFPPLDHLCECEIQYIDDGAQVPLYEFGRLRGKGAHEQLLAAAEMRVVQAPLWEMKMDEKGPLVDEEEVDERKEKISLEPLPVSIAPSALKSHLY